VAALLDGNEDNANAVLNLFLESTDDLTTDQLAALAVDAQQLHDPVGAAVARLSGTDDGKGEATGTSEPAAAAADSSGGGLRLVDASPGSSQPGVWHVGLTDESGARASWSGARVDAACGIQTRSRLPYTLRMS
jgi:hypothetical protein